ncbi:DUF3999 domain-containing protein [bacterium]|nr:DUF3999 domain-containing protein [bacterium]
MYKILLVSILLWSLPLRAAVPVPQDFAYGYKLDVDAQASLNKMELPDTVYQSTVNGEWGDMRVFNGESLVVPHTLVSGQKSVLGKEVFTNLSFYPLDVEQGNEMEIEYFKGILKTKTKNAAVTGDKKRVGFLIDASQLDFSPEKIILKWDSPSAVFMTLVSVEGSDNLSSWFTLSDTEALAMMQQGEHVLEQREIDLSARSDKYKYYRIIFHDEKPIFDLKQVLFKKPGESYLQDAKRVRIKGIKLGDNRYGFDMGGAYPWYNVKINLPQNNTVVPYLLYASGKDWKPDGFYLASGFAFKLAEKGEAVYSKTQAFERLARGRYFIVEFTEKEGGVGSGDVELELGYYPHDLVFLAQGNGPFTLAFGSAIVEPATFKVENVLGTPNVTLGKQNYGTAIIGEKIDLGGPDKLLMPVVSDKKVGAQRILWGALIAGVLFLFWMSRSLLKEMKG